MNNVNDTVCRVLLALSRKFTYVIANTSNLLRIHEVSMTWTQPQSWLKGQFTLPWPLSLLTRVWSPLSGQEFLACQLDSHCVVEEKLSQEMNILTGTWLSIYNTDNTYFSKSHFYSSIHVIDAEKKKVQLQRFHILNKFCSAEKKKRNKKKIKPKCQDNKFLCLFSTFGWFQGGWVGPLRD